MHSENEVELQSCVRPPHTYMYLSQLEVNFVIIIKCMVDKIHTGRPYRGDCKGIDLFNMAFGRERIFENIETKTNTARCCMRIYLYRI